MKRIKQKRRSPARNNSSSDDDDDSGPPSGGASSAAASTSKSSPKKRSADDAAISCAPYRASPAKQSSYAFECSSDDGAGRSQWSNDGAFDNGDLPSTESESDSDCDGVLPSLFQTIEVDSDDTEQDFSDVDAGARAAAAVLLRSVPPGPPIFELPPIFSGLRFREIHQSVQGCKDLMRVLVTCDADIIPAATTTSRKNASLIHRVVGVKEADDSSSSTEIVVDPAWVWQCVRAGRLLAV
eukprot:COSAG02_NODE_1207_length_13885_cov_124.791237_15_plen_240_part_00